MVHTAEMGLTPVKDRSMSAISMPWHGNSELQVSETATGEAVLPLMFLKWTSFTFTLDA